MPDNMDRVGIFAELATALAAVTYPIVRVLNNWIEKRRKRQERMLAATAALIELRLMERCDTLEQRISRMEKQ